MDKSRAAYKTNTVVRDAYDPYTTCVGGGLVHWGLAGITRFIGAPKHDGGEFNSTHNTHPTFTSLHASAMKASTMREAVGHSCNHLSQKVSLT